MFARISSVIAGGIGLYVTNEYEKYLKLKMETNESAAKITSIYMDLSVRNSKFEKIKENVAGMEWVMTTTPNMHDLWDFKDTFGSSYYEVRNDVKKLEILKSECVKTMENLSSEKMEYNSKNDQLRKNIYAKAKYIFFIKDTSDLIKKIEALPLNEIDQKGLICALGHWNTRLELAWVARTNAQELSSDFLFSNGAYLLNNIELLVKEDLSQRLNNNGSINKKDVPDITENSFAYLNKKLRNYHAIIYKVKYIEKVLKSESHLILRKELEGAIKDLKRIDDKLNNNVKALQDKALINLEETQMLQAWEEKIVISPTRWADKFEKTKMGLAEIYAQESLNVAHSIILCVLSTQATLVERKIGKKTASLTPTERKFIEVFKAWQNQRE